MHKAWANKAAAWAWAVTATAALCGCEEKRAVAPPAPAARPAAPTEPAPTEPAAKPAEAQPAPAAQPADARSPAEPTKAPAPATAADASSGDPGPAASFAAPPTLSGLAFDWRPPAVPPVMLTAAELASLKLAVGSKLPELSLTSPDGAPVDPAKHLGKRGTVLVFWSPQQACGREQIKDLKPLVLEPFSSAGLQVMCVAVGEGGDKTPVDAAAMPLQDKDGKALAALTSRAAPMTIVLDRTGAVRWFDLEYSRSTRRELRQVLMALAAE